MIARIDEYLLERVFTPIAWWFERKTERTNFYLAGQMLRMAMLAIMVAVGVAVTNSGDVLAIVTGTLFFGGMCLDILRVKREDDRVRRSPHTVMPRVGASFILGSEEAVRVLLILVGVFLVLKYAHQGFEEGWSSELVTELSYAISMLCYACGGYFMLVRRPPPRPRQEEIPDGKLVEI